MKSLERKISEKGLRLMQWMVVLGVSMLLTSCEFFYHQVEYNGQNKADHMVLTSRLVAGEAPCVMLNTSYFFQDSTLYGYIPTRYPDGTESKDYGLRRGWLQGATVEMQVGDGPWEPLPGQTKWIVVPRPHMYATFYEEAYVYTCDHVLQPGDEVHLRASHPDFKEKISAQQTIPYASGARVEMRKAVNDMLPFEVQLPSYEGALTDVMRITATVFVTDSFSESIFTGYDPDTYEEIYVDTLEMSHHQSYYVFSQGDGFDKYSNVNCELSRGYWGNNQMGLFHDANRTGSTMTLPILVEYVPWRSQSSTYNGIPTYRSTTTDSVVIEVHMATRDAYLQMASMVAGDYKDSYAPDNWADYDDTGYDDEFDEIVDEIRDMFEELGNLEGVQIFSNVENGVGFLTAENKQRYVFVMGAK